MMVHLDIFFYIIKENCDESDFKSKSLIRLGFFYNL